MRRIICILLIAVIVATSILTSFASANNEYEKGDVDLNGDVNVMDATTTQRHLAQIITLQDIQLSLADTNSDYIISIMDVTLIQLHIAGLLDEFPQP